LDEQEQQELVLGAMLLVQVTRVYSLNGLLDAICHVVDVGSGAPHADTDASAGASAGVAEVPVYHLVVVDGMSRALAAALPVDASTTASVIIPGSGSAAGAATGTHSASERATSIAKTNTRRLVSSICLAYRACAALGSTVLVTIDLDTSSSAAVDGGGTGSDLKSRSCRGHSGYSNGNGNGYSNGNGNGSGTSASVGNASVLSYSKKSLSLHQGVVGSHSHVGNGNSTGTANGEAAGPLALASHIHPDLVHSGCMASMAGIFDVSLSVQNLTPTSANPQYAVNMVSRGISHRYSNTIHVSVEGRESLRQTLNPIQAVFTDSMLCYGMT